MTTPIERRILAALITDPLIERIIRDDATVERRIQR